MPEWWGQIPWGLVTAIAGFVAGVGFRALKQTLGENFISNKTFDDRLAAVGKEIAGISDAVKGSEGTFKNALVDFDRRMDQAEKDNREALKSHEREILAHLEKHYATVGQLDGLGARLTETERRVSGAIDTFARGQDQILDRASRAETLSQATDAKVERFIAVMEERLKPLDSLRKTVENLETRIDARLEARNGEILTELRNASRREPAGR